MKKPDTQITIKPVRRLESIVTKDENLIKQAQQLRYKVFASEMGAKLQSDEEGIDCDKFDSYCDHLIVYDNQNGSVVGYTRLLNGLNAEKAGGFYSQSEFNLDQVLSLPGRFLEIGRTCVDSSYRGSAVLTILWSGLVKYLLEGQYDYLFGCASISPGPNGFAVDSVYRNIEAKNIAPSSIAVTPHREIPDSLMCQRDESGIPPLLKAYLRFGVFICGDPYWDESFNVMDLFILLPMTQIETRYSKHYIKDQLQTDESLQPSVN